jgi:hypothetical protein
VSETRRFCQDLRPEEHLPSPTKSSTEGGATQLSLRFGHSDWPVKRSEARSTSVIEMFNKLRDAARLHNLLQEKSRQKSGGLYQLFFAPYFLTKP